MSARAAAKRGMGEATDAELESAAALEELKAQLARSEVMLGKYESTIQGLNERLMEAVGEQGRLEDKLHEAETEVERLRGDVKEMVKRAREKEQQYEADVGGFYSDD